MLSPSGQDADVVAASATRGRRRRVAMLLSCDSFEKFFGGTFGLDRDT